MVARTDSGISTDGAVSDSDHRLSVRWKDVVGMVSRLQARIVKAAKTGDKKRLRGLRRLLVNSKAAKLPAVKRVTSNRGKKTAGVDGVILKTPAEKWQEARKPNCRRYKPKPLKRMYIPKKNGKKRPLGIPTMRDRGEQSPELMAPDPVAECTADMHSYGFRKKRSVHDAIEACYNALRLKGSAQWILEADIKGCFDNINHGWMTENIPVNKIKLGRWLKSGYMERGMFYPTKAGTPQGGIISPTPANMVPDGLQNLPEANFKKYQKVHFVRYADDFIITGVTKELLENEVKPPVKEFPEKRGLELSEEKTKISHINDGFDFLGFNIRKINGKMRTRPAKSSIKSVKAKIRETVRKNRTVKTESLIKQLNPIIRGWSGYYRHVVSKRIFGKTDHEIWEIIRPWAKRRHPKKSLKRIKSKYFQCEGNREWVFREKGGNDRLLKMNDTPVRRHVKIRADANPYDSQWCDYFTEREKKKHKRNVRSKRSKMWIKQHGICPVCRLPLDNDEEERDIHHIIPKSEGGSEDIKNLTLLHLTCHRQTHSVKGLQPDASRRLISA